MYSTLSPAEAARLIPAVQRYAAYYGRIWGNGDVAEIEGQMLLALVEKAPQAVVKSGAHAGERLLDQTESFICKWLGGWAGGRTRAHLRRTAYYVSTDLSTTLVMDSGDHEGQFESVFGEALAAPEDLPTDDDAAVIAITARKVGVEPIDLERALDCHVGERKHIAIRLLAGETERSIEGAGIANNRQVRNARRDLSTALAAIA
jgi:hypothetical protein